MKENEQDIYPAAELRHMLTLVPNFSAIDAVVDEFSEHLISDGLRYIATYWDRLDAPGAILRSMLKQGTIWTNPPKRRSQESANSGTPLTPPVVMAPDPTSVDVFDIRTALSALPEGRRVEIESEADGEGQKVAHLGKRMQDRMRDAHLRNVLRTLSDKGDDTLQVLADTITSGDSPVSYGDLSDSLRTRAASVDADFAYPPEMETPREHRDGTA